MEDFLEIKGEDSLFLIAKKDIQVISNDDTYTYMYVKGIPTPFYLEESFENIRRKLLID